MLIFPPTERPRPARCPTRLVYPKCSPPETKSSLPYVYNGCLVLLRRRFPGTSSRPPAFSFFNLSLVRRLASCADYPSCPRFLSFAVHAACVAPPFPFFRFEAPFASLFVQTFPQASIVTPSVLLSAPNVPLPVLRLPSLPNWDLTFNRFVPAKCFFRFYYTEGGDSVPATLVRARSPLDVSIDPCRTPIFSCIPFLSREPRRTFFFLVWAFPLSCEPCTVSPCILSPVP